MGTKYTTTTVSGYNASPPADDGSQVASNQVLWSTIKTKLPDPIKTALESINSKLVTALDTSVTLTSVSYNTLAGDHAKTVQIASTTSPAVTINLGDAATMAAGYYVTITNQSAYTCTIGRVTSGDTINGTAANLYLPPKWSATFKVNSAANGYNVESMSDNTFSVNQGYMKNKIIGGDFTINPWQRGTTFTALATGSYGADRFRVDYSSDAVVDCLKTADAPTASEANHYTAHCLHLDVTTADASIAAGQYYLLSQKIEGYTAACLGLGQSGTRYFTLSFWVKATKTGTYCVSFQNSAQNRSYVAEYSVGTTDTWEKKTITVSVDTSGTWLYDNGVGLSVFWTIAAGSTYQTTAGSWQTANAFATSNQVNGLDSTSNNFKLALVQLEAGPVATQFEARDYGTELNLCRRYLYALKPEGFSDIAQGWCYSTTQSAIYVPFPVRPRAIPSGITVSNTTHFQLRDATLTGVNLSTLPYSSACFDGCLLLPTVASGLTAGYGTALYAASSSGYILFTGAEL